MDLLSFIRTADPMKVRVAERQRVENKPRLLESTVGRVVSLFPIAPSRASSELEASDVALLQPKRQRKRKTDVANVGGPSHPPKKLREDYRALGRDSTAGKSMSRVQSLFTGAVLNDEARGEPISTLPFVTSFVSATPEREDKSLADSVTGLNLRTIGAPQRFVISSDSSHHFGANIAEAEVDSIVRAPVVPSLFGVGSSLTRRTDSVPDDFFDVSGCNFLIGDIRTVVDPDSDLQKVYVLRWSATNRFGLDDSRICLEMLDEFAPLKFFASVHEMDHDQLFTEFNRKRKLIAVVDEQAKLLKFKDGEIESLKAQLLLKEAEATEAIRLRLRSSNLKLLSNLFGVKWREQEVADLDAQVTAVKLQNDNLADQVATYEDFIGQLEKFQDKKLEEVNEKFDKVYADFVDIALHIEENFYPHLLTTISGHQWLLTYSMELAVVKCLNSTEYLSALGAVISKVVEKGMQEGISIGITHGAEGRKLADVAAYNPSAEADYLSDLQRLQNVNFSLIAKLKSNKDAIIDTIMNLLRLDDRVVGAFALSLSLEVSHSWVKKMRENIAKHVSALRGVFVPLSEPLFATALEGMEGNSGSTHDTTTTLSTTFVFASTGLPISTDDYEVAHADGQGVPCR
nr:hypothetical protein [Tanacetum cinerariifolium]